MGEALANFWLLTSVGETNSDSGMTSTKKSNKGKPFARFWLLTSVGETDSDSELTYTPPKNGTSLSFIDKKVSAIS